MNYFEKRRVAEQELYQKALKTAEEKILGASRTEALRIALEFYLEDFPMSDYACSDGCCHGCWLNRISEDKDRLARLALSKE